MRSASETRGLRTLFEFCRGSSAAESRGQPLLRLQHRKRLLWSDDMCRKNGRGNCGFRRLPPLGHIGRGRVRSRASLWCMPPGVGGIWIGRGPNTAPGRCRPARTCRGNQALDVIPRTISMMADALGQNTGDTSGHATGQGTTNHRPQTQTGQIGAPLGRDTADPSDLDPYRSEIRKAR